MASKRQNSVIAEQSPAVGSTTGDESPSDISVSKSWEVSLLNIAVSL